MSAALPWKRLSMTRRKSRCERPSPKRLRRDRRCKPQPRPNKVAVCEYRPHALCCTENWRHCLGNHDGILIATARPFAPAVRRAGEGLGRWYRYCFPLGSGGPIIFQRVTTTCEFDPADRIVTVT